MPSTFVKALSERSDSDCKIYPHRTLAAFYKCFCQTVVIHIREILFVRNAFLRLQMIQWQDENRNFWIESDSCDGITCSVCR